MAREAGIEPALTRFFAIGRQLREGLLVTVLDDYTDRSGPLRVLWPSSRHLAPKLRVFVDFLVANLGPAVEGESDKAGDSRISSKQDRSPSSQGQSARCYLWPCFISASRTVIRDRPTSVLCSSSLR